MSRRYRTDFEVIEAMRAEAEQLGSDKALAKKMGIHPSYVSDIFLGHRRPGPKVLRYYGLERGLVPLDRAS